MADSGGHWASLAAAQKLTQSTKIPGVFETDIKRNNPMDMVPVAQAAGTGTSIKWLREKMTLEDEVQDLAPGGQLNWNESMDYDEVETFLRIKGMQRKLDQYVRDIYGTYEDYKAIVLLEMEKGLKRKIGDSMIYSDLTYGGDNQFDGMHAFAAEQTSSNLNIDNSGYGELGLSLANLRAMIDEMKLGCDELWLPFTIKNRINAAYEEKGFAGLAYNVSGALAQITRGVSDIGKQILFWDGIPFVPMDYLVAEQFDTGAGSNIRAKYSSGTKAYSIFGVHFGNVMEKVSGFCLAYGGTEGQGDLYKFVPFPNLEDFDAEGMRMVSYLAMLFSVKYCLGRIYDIADAAITV
jgi:hypothetical protein